MRRELCCYINRGRTVGTAYDTDSACLRLRESEENSACEGYENTDLSRRAENKALGVGDEWTEVCHAADAEEDERRIDSELNTLIEIVEQSAVGGVFIIGHAVYHPFGVPGYFDVLSGALVGGQQLN